MLALTSLSLYKKRSGAKFVKNLTKHQRFLKGSLRIWFYPGFKLLADVKPANDSAIVA